MDNRQAYSSRVTAPQPEFWTPFVYGRERPSTVSTTPLMVTQPPFWSFYADRLNGAIDWSAALNIFDLSMQSLIFLFSLVGNLLVLASVFAIRGLRSKKTNLIFVLALTIADLLVTLFVMPFHIVQNAIGYWPFGAVFCDIFVGNDIFFCTASLLGIMSIAVERYIAVFKPLRYNAIMTNRVSVGIVVGSWIVSLILSHMPVHLHFHSKTHKKSAFDPTLERCKLDVNPAYALISSAVSYWVPCLVMGFVYFRIYFGAKRQLDQLCQAAPLLVPQLWPFPVEKAVGVNGEPSAASSVEQGDQRDSMLSTSQKDAKVAPVIALAPTKSNAALVSMPSQRRKNLRTKVLLGRILGCFIICWSPFFTLLLLDSIGAFNWLFDDGSVAGALCLTWMFKAAVWLSYANSVANPFIYAMSNHEIATFWGKWRKRCWARFVAKSNDKEILTSGQPATTDPQSTVTKTKKQHLYKKASESIITA